MRYNSIFAIGMRIIIIFLVFLVIIFPRFWKLGELPMGTHVDEPSFAIEAQSLVENGYDTWGASWPAYFKAYGEYKAPGLIYSYVPLIKLLGHTNTLISRLPSAILGLGTLLVTYLIIQLLWPKLSIVYRIFAILILAFSPWFFGTSRVYFETNGGLFFVVLGIYALLKSMLSNKYFWVTFGSSVFALSGYWYASYRYIVIIIMLGYLLIDWISWRETFKKSLLIFILFLIVGSGWINYLFSTEGLKRLSHYQGITKFGATLVIDEKRAYCFLSFDRDPSKTKICYALWNKPFEKINAVSTTLLRYLSPEFLFFDSNKEYGVDIDYGAYQWPMLPLYVIGLYALIKSLSIIIRKILIGKKFHTDFYEKANLIIIVTTISGFLTASITEQINLHRAMVGLWSIYIIITIGITNVVYWIQKFSQKKVLPFITYLYILYCFIYILQSQVNYFFVYTRTNDESWRSDMGNIYTKLSVISSDYDRIIDTVYMGPIDASFYGLLPTNVLSNSERTPENPEGWSFISKAGKFEMSRLGLEHYVCEKIKMQSHDKVLVITRPYPEYQEVALLRTHSWDGVHAMHDLYDLDALIAYQAKNGVNHNSLCK